MITSFYDENKQSIIQSDLLYHYTNSSALFKILKTMELKPSSLMRLNDSSETSFRWVDYNLAELGCERVFNRFSIISFTKDYYRNKVLIKGTLHPRMWAQYADNNCGACIVIREKKLYESNMAYFSNKCSLTVIEKVSYNKPKPVISTKTFNLRKDYRKVFFHKDIDWSSEHEYRFLGEDAPKYLSLNNAIEYICLGPNFFACQDAERNAEGIIMSLLNSDNKSSGQLSTGAFAQIAISEGMYKEVSANSTITELINKIKTK